MKKIKLFSVLVIYAAFVTACGNKPENVTPYSKAKVIRYAKELFHDDIVVVSSEKVSSGNYRYDMKKVRYTVELAGKPGVQFTISSYIEEQNFGLMPNSPVLYSRYYAKLYTDYFSEVGRYYEEDIQKIVEKYGLSLEESLYFDLCIKDAEFENFNDIASCIAEINNLLDFQYDIAIDNPLNPKHNWDYIRRVHIEDIGVRVRDYLVSEFTYTIYNEQKYTPDAVLKELESDYIDLINKGKIEDASVPYEKLREYPLRNINKLVIGDTELTDMDWVDFTYSPELNTYIMSCRFRSETTLWEKIIKCLGGEYKITKAAVKGGWDETDIIEWEVNGNSFSMEITYDSDDVSGIKIKKNNEILEIQALEEPKYKSRDGRADVYFKIEDIERLLEASLIVDQDEKCIRLEPIRNMQFSSRERLLAENYCYIYFLNSTFY